MQPESIPTTTRFARRPLATRALLAVVALSIFAAQPALAQASNPLCTPDTASLVQMMEGFFTIAIALGVMGLLIAWQTDALFSMATIDPDRLERLKRHRRIATTSALILLVSGPLFTVAADIMGLPVASCVDLIPF